MLDSHLIFVIRIYFWIKYYYFKIIIKNVFHFQSKL